MLVECTISNIELEGDYGEIESVRARCSFCGHTTESFGRSERSVKRCLLLMRKQCPREEQHYYVKQERA